jgi:uncharacterized spore protein YtfJ
MNIEFGGIVASTVKSQEEAMGLVEKLFDVAQPGTVFGEPVTIGDHTVITASEVRVSMGFGFGSGGGSGPSQPASEGEGEAEAEAEAQGTGVGFGGGGGGGGVSGGRPVATIIVGPDGVRVEPVVDPTKIALAFFTTLGAMLMVLGRMRAASRKWGDS